MKFIALKSRGGDYMVVAENVAWLRSYENGQTQVGIIGSSPLRWFRPPSPASAYCLFFGTGCIGPI